MNQKANVEKPLALVVDDEPSICESLEWCAFGRGLEG